MKTDRPVAVGKGVSLEQAGELVSAYIRALIKIIPTMSSDEVQALITAPGDSLVKAVGNMRLPLIAGSFDGPVNYGRYLDDAIRRSGLNFSNINNLDKFLEPEKGQHLRKVCALKLFKSGPVAGVIRQINSIGLNLGSLEDFLVAVTNVLTIKQMEENDVFALIPNWQTPEEGYNALYLKAGEKRVLSCGYSDRTELVLHHNLFFVGVGRSTLGKYSHSSFGD
jgi:hypothetical protein